MNGFKDLWRPWRRGGGQRLPRIWLGCALAAAAATPTLAFVGFVTIAPREKVSALVYNAADLTLVRDTRRVVFKQGENSLRYEWANTLIDPTSLTPFAPPGVRLKNTTYPLSEGESLVWNFDSPRQVAGKLDVQYFTSGLSWRADHVAVLTGPGQARLETWVKVNNHTGEDFDTTAFSLVVGEVRLIETIRELAYRFKPRPPEAMPAPSPGAGEYMDLMKSMDRKEKSAPRMANGHSYARNGAEKPKEVTRESLSELHVYRIEGTESVPTGGARRMRAFDVPSIKVTDTYRCVDPDEDTAAERVLTFENKKDNKLGVQPLPEGVLQLFRSTAAGLTYEGRGNLPYTPMGEKAETPLGYTPGVACRAVTKNTWKDKIKKDILGRIIGWEDVRKIELTLLNGAGQTAAFEVRQHFSAPFSANLTGAKKEDVSTLLYKTSLTPRQKKSVTYEVRERQGVLAEE